MAVNLSPVGGVAAQFFDNSGQVLTGGKLYTYLAGTTTPAATYTTNSGLTANSNPIVLNAAGRVADSGEIWLTDGINYKFVLKDSNDVQIAVWDNISGINSNFVNYTLQEQTFTATQGQTVFTLTGGIQYTPATNNLSVFVNGSKQVAGTNYLETSSTVFTFLTGLNVGDVVDAITAIPVATNVISSNNVSYNQGSTGAVTTNVQAKLQQTVSVKDFGAVGDGVTNDTAAIQNATNTGLPIYFPAGTYKMLSAVTYTGTVVWTGCGAKSIIKCDGVVLNVTSGNNSIIDNLYLQPINFPNIISRNVSTWASNPAVVASSSVSHNGYQPTVNDLDLSPTPTYTTIGPTIYFQQNATNINVSRIFGLFVTVNLYDAVYSTVRDCTFQGGTGLGGIVFWNINNQQGERNAAINNNITYASFSGITFARNYDGIAQGNIISYCGESGIKTYQGTLSGTDARCYHMQFIGNTTMYQYYDGYDFTSDNPRTGTIDSRHQIIGNMTYGNHGVGFFADGINNQFIGNNSRSSQLAGFDLYYSQSLISDNYGWGNNASNTGSGQNQLQCDGSSNVISNNYLNPASYAGYALYATGTNVVSNNRAISGQIFLGNSNLVTAQIIGNVDNQYGISGTFTPTVTVGSTVQSTYTIQQGLYTRVGQRVFFDITVQLNGAIFGTGLVSITGLPATASSSGVYGATGSVLGVNCTYSGELHWFINDGGTSIALITNSGGGTLTSITNSVIGASSKFYISGSYLAAQ